jgi:hypothetical protein
MGIDVAFSRMQPVFEAAKSAKSDGKNPAKMGKSLSDYAQVLKSQLIAWTKLTPACPNSAKWQNRQDPGTLYMQNNIFHLSTLLFSIYIFSILYSFPLKGKRLTDSSDFGWTFAL